MLSDEKNEVCKAYFDFKFTIWYVVALKDFASTICNNSWHSYVPFFLKLKQSYQLMWNGL